MSDNTIELVRDVNPFPLQVSAPPFEVMLERVENDRAAASQADDLHGPRRDSQPPAAGPAADDH